MIHIINNLWSLLENIVKDFALANSQGNMYQQLTIARYTLLEIEIMRSFI